MRSSFKHSLTGLLCWLKLAAATDISQHTNSGVRCARELKRSKELNEDEHLASCSCQTMKVDAHERAWLCELSRRVAVEVVMSRASDIFAVGSAENWRG